MSGTFTEEELQAFAAENNRLALRSPPTIKQVRALRHFLQLSYVSAGDCLELARVYAPDAALRNNKSIPLPAAWPAHCRFLYAAGFKIPPSTTTLCKRFSRLLDEAAAGSDPWTTHVEILCLLPLTAANGRVARAIWAWQMIRQKLPAGMAYDPRPWLSMPFAWSAYGQAVAATASAKLESAALSDEINALEAEVEALEDAAS